MKLTPLDIQQQQFRTTLGGFDKKEVDAFLDLVATAFEDLLRDNHAQRDELTRKEAALEEHRERERTLKETMITATRISEDIKQGARKEAEIVIKQAELQAEQIIQNAHTRLMRVMEDIDELRRQKAQFESQLQSIISTHQKLLDAVSERETPSLADVEAINPRPLELASKSARPKLATVAGREDTAPREGTEADRTRTQGG
jgi:cell division initiation protein